MSDNTPLTFFSPPERPDDEQMRQAVVDGFRLVDAGDDAELAAIVSEAAALFGVSGAAISIIDQTRQRWIVRQGLATDGTARAISFCGHVVAAPDGVMVVPDAAEDRRFAGNPLVDGRMGAVRFYAGAPLLHDGTALGALCVVGDAPQVALDEAATRRLAALADRVVAILAARYR